MLAGLCMLQKAMFFSTSPIYTSANHAQSTTASNFNKMIYSTIITTLLASTALALLQATCRPPVFETNVTYYQGAATEPKTCGQQVVAKGNITSDECNPAYTHALAVQPLQNRDCFYVLWRRTESCGPGMYTDVVRSSPQRLCCIECIC